MALSRVLGRGQVTLPREVRQGARINPGDILNMEVIGPGQLRLTVLPNRSPRELRARYPIDTPIDEQRDRAAWQAEAAAEVLGAKDV